MKKSKIVSYSSEELKQMRGQSDWEANAAMTDEEIEAAIASDPEEAEMHAGWNAAMWYTQNHVLSCASRTRHMRRISLSTRSTKSSLTVKPSGSRWCGLSTT